MVTPVYSPRSQNLALSCRRCLLKWLRGCRCLLPLFKLSVNFTVLLSTSATGTLKKKKTATPLKVFVSLQFELIFSVPPHLTNPLQKKKSQSKQWRRYSQEPVDSLFMISIGVILPQYLCEMLLWGGRLLWLALECGKNNITRFSYFVFHWEKGAKCSASFGFWGVNQSHSSSIQPDFQ